MICRDHCAEHVDFDATLAARKTKLMNGRVIGERAFDIVVSPDSTGATTLLLTVERQVRPDFMQMLRDYALTQRELIVAKMIERGFTNIYSKLGMHAGMLSALRMS
ncbi:MAG: hypothetical protein HYW49_04790 [Deltaproteobacteria bacterium]|nr:hypothetical protein [Deltaproteobacteria bacterium]